MDTTFIITVFLSFGLSFIFALGGIGSAIALVPALHWLGVPFAAAKPTGLMVNTLSMSGANYANIKNRRLDFRMVVPIIIASALLAPLGAWSTVIIPKAAVMMVFVAFLLFSGTMLLFYRGRENATGFREDRPIAAPAAFAVPFSSFIGFIAYAMMGNVASHVLLPASLAAYAGGYLGTGVMQRRMEPSAVKKFSVWYCLDWRSRCFCGYSEDE